MSARCFCKRCGAHHCGRGCSLVDEDVEYHGASRHCDGSGHPVPTCPRCRYVYCKCPGDGTLLYDWQARDAGRQALFFDKRRTGRTLDACKEGVLQRCAEALKTKTPHRRERYMARFREGVDRACEKVGD